MSRRKIHFGNKQKAESFCNEVQGNFHENKGNTEKPYTVSFKKTGRARLENNPYHGSMNGEMDDYAWTADDL